MILLINSQPKDEAIRLYPTSMPIGKKKDIKKMIEEGGKP